jgi:hypothetical protein
MRTLGFRPSHSFFPQKKFLNVERDQRHCDHAFAAEKNAMQILADQSALVEVSNAADNAKSPPMQSSLLMALSRIVTPHVCGRPDQRPLIDILEATRNQEMIQLSVSRA